MRMIIIYFSHKINTILQMKISIFLTLLLFQTVSFAECKQAQDASKIVIAGGSLTEIIYFLEEEERISGVDVTSNYPQETANLPSIGYVRALSTEGILSLKPTLILGEDDMGPPLVIDQLELTGLDLRIINEVPTAKGILEKIECISSILNGENRSESDQVSMVKQDIKSLADIAEVNSANGIKVMLILNMQGTSPIVAGKGTSGDGFIKMTGAKNAADTFEGWKPINSESIISYDPDYIIITKRGMSSFPDIASLADTTALKFTQAAQNGNIISEDGMAMLGFGVRTISTALKFAEMFDK